MTMDDIDYDGLTILMTSTLLTTTTSKERRVAISIRSVFTINQKSDAEEEEEEKEEEKEDET